MVYLQENALLPFDLSKVVIVCFDHRIDALVEELSLCCTFLEVVIPYVLIWAHNVI